MRVKLSSLKPCLFMAGLSLSAALLTLQTPLMSAGGAASPAAGARQDSTNGRGDREPKNSEDSSKQRTPRPPPPSESLRRAQEALKLAGYDAGPANGLANRRTTAALRKFQADRGLRVTGRTDAPTLAALGLAGGAAPRPPSVCGADPPQSGTGRQHSVDLGGRVKLEMVEVPPGTFCRGAMNGSADERPVLRVKIGYSFFMGKYEVTQAQWHALMGDNPSLEKGDDLPEAIARGGA
jgi:formylglycine-generating enzyme required for sulfatase activity